jgi:hypothetical protein
LGRCGFLGGNGKLRKRDEEMKRREEKLRK